MAVRRSGSLFFWGKYRYKEPAIPLSVYLAPLPELQRSLPHTYKELENFLKHFSVLFIELVISIQTFKMTVFTSLIAPQQLV